MQNRTGQTQAETFIPTETVMAAINGPNFNRTFKVPRKATKRAVPWTLTARPLNLESPPQAEDIPARKKQRLEKPLSTTIGKAARKNASSDVSAGLHVAALVPSRTKDQCRHRLDAADLNDDDENAYPVTNTQPQPNAGAKRKTRRWTLVKDAKLTDAVRKIKLGKEDRIDWVAVAALVPSRTKKQCNHRWHDTLDPRIDRANRRTCNWEEDEDNTLRKAIEMHGGKDWNAIATLVPGRTKTQCRLRWHSFLVVNKIDRANGRTGKWAVDEDKKLKDAVKMHGSKDWDALAALVPGRTKMQCYNRWQDVLDTNIRRVTGRKGRWTSDEDSKLKDAVQRIGNNDWDPIADLVPGRTKSQCCKRWHDFLVSNIDQADGRTRNKWTADEDSKLASAIQTHGEKDWPSIAALVPGRTKRQCGHRWKKLRDPNRRDSTVRGT
jgi:hypothetical protein